MPGALEGVRAVDFGHYIAGPLAATMLSDQGADVVHVDPPGGPRWNTDADAFLNRGKRRISLDLKQPDDLAIAQRLVDGADVLIENFRPGVMDRLGLDRKSTRLNSSHEWISYAVFCLKKKKKEILCLNPRQKYKESDNREL